MESCRLGASILVKRLSSSILPTSMFVVSMRLLTGICTTILRRIESLKESFFLLLPLPCIFFIGQVGTIWFVLLVATHDQNEKKKQIKKIFESRLLDWKNVIN